MIDSEMFFLSSYGKRKLTVRVVIPDVRPATIAVLVSMYFSFLMRTIFPSMNMTKTIGKKSINISIPKNSAPRYATIAYADSRKTMNDNIRLELFIKHSVKTALSTSRTFMTVIVILVMKLVLTRNRSDNKFIVFSDTVKIYLEFLNISCNLQ